MTNKMHFFALIYFNNHHQDVAKILAIHHQEVASLYMQRMVFIMRLR
jgi:hypothetical protein